VLALSDDDDGHIPLRALAYLGLYTFDTGAGGILHIELPLGTAADDFAADPVGANYYCRSRRDFIDVFRCLYSKAAQAVHYLGVVYDGPPSVNGSVSTGATKYRIHGAANAKTETALFSLYNDQVYLLSIYQIYRKYK
jgi:hypothetical protein